jgi:D-lactate dehydrogenase (cytochrome)
VNRWAKLDYPELTTLFFEFHGSPASVAEQVETVSALAAENGGGQFSWSNRPEERSKLWKARHQAYYAAVGLRPGCVGWPTDVCVPIGRLAECIGETKRDLEAAGVVAPILGHVGDGNFHVVFVIDPNRPEEIAQAESLNRRMVERALAMDGTCTGEHGVGQGKMKYLAAEHGEPALEAMRAIKRALDPLDIMNPGKIVNL